MTTTASGRCHRLRLAGFTLIELIVVIVLMGVLAFVAVPRFQDRAFDERGLRDAAKAAISHARHVAVGARRFVCANLTPGSGSAGTLALRMDTTLPEAVATVDCGGTNGVAIALPVPARGCAATNEVCAPSGVNLGGSSLIFDPLGRPVAANRAVQAATLSVTISNQPAISIAAETGYVE